MVADLRSTELSVRVGSVNGVDTLSTEDIENALAARNPDGKRRFFVREIEGASLDGKILAQTVRQVLADNIYGPLSRDLEQKVRDIGEEWDRVRDRVEPLLQGKFAVCPSCGSQAMSAPLCDGVKFICPHCEMKLRWKHCPDAKHPDGGRYVLEK